MIKHECKYKYPGCLCNRCKNDTPDIECCLWDDYGYFSPCPTFECERFEPEETAT